MTMGVSFAFFDAVVCVFFPALYSFFAQRKREEEEEERGTNKHSKARRAYPGINTTMANDSSSLRCIIQSLIKSKRESNTVPCFAIWRSIVPTSVTYMLWGRCVG